MYSSTLGYWVLKISTFLGLGKEARGLEGGRFFDDALILANDCGKSLRHDLPCNDRLPLRDRSAVKGLQDQQA